MANLTVTELPTGQIEITAAGDDPYTVNGSLTVRKDTDEGNCGFYNSNGSRQFVLYPAGTDGVDSVVEADATAHPVTDLDELYDALILIF